MRLGIENHPEATPAELRRKITAADEAGHPGVFGTTVDTGWWGTQGYDAAVAIEELADRLLHVHLKDVRAVSEPHETCRWGDGIVPIERCVRTLRHAHAARAMARLNVALVGAGNIAARYAACIVAQPRLAFAGATDLAPGRAAELVSAHGGRAYDSLDAVLADEAVHVVVNLTVPSRSVPGRRATSPGLPCGTACV